MAEMEQNRDQEKIISNHLVADGTEDVVLQNVDQTISNDLTEGALNHS